MDSESFRIPLRITTGPQTNTFNYLKFFFFLKSGSKTLTCARSCCVSNPVMACGGEIYFLLGNATDKRFNDRPEKRIQCLKNARGRLIKRVLPTVRPSSGSVGLAWQPSDERSVNILNPDQTRGASAGQSRLMDPALLKPVVEHHPARLLSPP